MTKCSIASENKDEYSIQPFKVTSKDGESAVTDKVRGEGFAAVVS